MRVRVPPSAQKPHICIYFLMIKTFSYKNIQILQKGDTPSVLILSGMHGDESDVIQPVTRYLYTHAGHIPDFIYIPEVSPSAITAKTRLNKQGHDINRCFVDSTTDLEAQELMKFLQHVHFHMSLDFHEDNEHRNAFYFYDTGEMHTDELDQFRSDIQNCEFELYSGIDDPEDPHLGCVVDKGYVSHGHEKDSHASGFLTKWMSKYDIVRRSFTFEIPGQAQLQRKKLLIETIFTYFFDSNFMVQ